MRRRFVLLATSTALALGAAVVAAPAAEARNLGGSQIEGARCVTPGHATLGSPNSGLPCLCVILPSGRIVLNVAKQSNKPCPPGIVGLP